MSNKVLKSITGEIVSMKEALNRAAEAVKKRQPERKEEINKFLQSINEEE